MSEIYILNDMSIIFLYGRKNSTVYDEENYTQYICVEKEINLKNLFETDKAFFPFELAQF